MTRATLDHVLHYARALAGSVADLPESCLLDRFLGRGEEAAFAALIERHGPMVLGVCRRVLGNAADAEDAFQATFLVLARRAAGLRKRASVASWLYGVACRVAWRARADAARRRRHERQAQTLHPAPTPTDVPPDLGDVLGEELARLPETYRLPVVLCYLEGRTNEEAARLLGWPVGSVKGRLSRARELLRSRLTRRGLAPSAALFGTALAGQVSEAVPAALAQTTLRAALATGPEAAEAVSAPVAALAREALRQGPWARLKVTLAVVVLLAAVGGAAALVQRDAPPPLPAEQQAVAPAAAQKPAGGPPGAVAAPVDLYGDPLPPGARARLGTVRFRHGSQVYALAYSPDGKTLASVSQERMVHVWDAATGRLVWVLVSLEGRFWRLAFSPDGKLLAASGADRTIRLLDPLTGKEVRCLVGHRGAASVAFSADGKRLASAGMDGQLILWEVATGKEVRRLQVVPRGLGCVAFAPDGKTVVVGGPNNPLRALAVATGRELYRLPAHGGGGVAAEFYPDGQLLATGTTGGQVTLWHAGSGKLFRRLPDHKGPVGSLAFARDGKILIAGQFVSSLLPRAGAAVRFWDVSTGKELRRLRGCDGAVAAVALAPDGKTLAVADCAAIRRWNLQTGLELAPLGGHRGTVYAVSVTANGKTVFTANEDGTIRRWDAGTGKEVRSLPGQPSAVHSLQLSADGKLLCWGGSDRAVHLWDLTGARPARQLPAARTQGFRALALAPDGRTLATSSDSQGLSLWDTTTVKELRCVAPDQLFYCLGFAPDGKTLASGGSDRQGYQRLKFWDVATGKELSSNSGVESFTGVAFSPDGKTVAASLHGSGDDAVRLYDARAVEVRRFRGHRGHALGVAFAPNGWMIASAGEDHTVRLWEVATGQERRRLEGHQGRVLSVAFSKDGRTLVSGGDDTTVLVWDVAGGAGKGAPTRVELGRRWDELSGADAVRAYEAICRLAAFPKQSVPLLRERLLGGKGPANKVARWIRELDDKQFAVRERATAELKKLGRQVEADLRQALATASAEARRRLARLLADLPGPAGKGPEGEPLQVSRALEALELAGTAEARRLVEALAAGPVNSARARQARAVLRRLGKPPTP